MDPVAFKEKAVELLGDEVRIFKAPGRVNLIGEHTDYNDGFVMPAAIDREMLMAAVPSGNRQVTLRSLDFNAVSTFSLDEIGYDAANSWSNYLRGVCFILEQAGYYLRGADIIFSGDVPRGSGLSSSAALEVATATTFLTLAEYDVTGEEIAKLCQKAENEFVGTKCGIMDQFISALGQAGKALMIDCRSLDYLPVNIPDGIKIIIGDTGVRRKLVTSEYNKRREECEKGVEILKTVLPDITALRDVTPEQLDANKGLLEDLTYRRCKHVVTEDARVLDAIKYMETGDANAMGLLLNASHESLRYEYEVSCAELDIMVEISRKQPGVYGSRMTGAGFGGCTVTIIDEKYADIFAAAVLPEYIKLAGDTQERPEIYVCSPSAGAGEI